MYLLLAQELKSLASAHGERLLHTPHNPISLGKLTGPLTINWSDFSGVKITFMTWFLFIFNISGDKVIITCPGRGSPLPQLCLWMVSRPRATRRWLSLAPCCSPGKCQEPGMKNSDWESRRIWRCEWVCILGKKSLSLSNDRMSCVQPNKMASESQQSAWWICWIWQSRNYSSWLDCRSYQGRLLIYLDVSIRIHRAMLWLLGQLGHSKQPCFFISQH